MTVRRKKKMNSRTVMRLNIIWIKEAIMDKTLHPATTPTVTLIGNNSMILHFHFP